MTAIDLKGVSKAFVDGERTMPVIDRMDLSVQPGETVALCGPSGSGKSTLLNLIAGLLPVDDGQVWVSPGAEEQRLAVHELDDGGRTQMRRRWFGFVFQFFNLVPTLTVAENVSLPLALNGLEDRTEQAVQRLARLGLDDRLDAFPEELSGGEQQRVAVARALAHRPPVLLADEPTGNLDQSTGDAVAELLWEEVAEVGCCLLVATHSSVLADRADRVVTLG